MKLGRWGESSGGPESIWGKAKSMIKKDLWNKIKYIYLCISTSLDKITKMSSIISL